MKSLDSVKSAKEISRKKISPKFSQDSTSFSKVVNRRNQKKSFISSSSQEQAKRSLLWILVGGTMVIVIVGWLFFLPHQLSQSLSTKGGGFREITQGFSEIFQKIDEGLKEFRSTFPSQFKLTNEGAASEEGLKEAQIKELERKTFPQFENSNLKR